MMRIAEKKRWDSIAIGSRAYIPDGGLCIKESDSIARTVHDERPVFVHQFQTVWVPISGG